METWEILTMSRKEARRPGLVQLAVADFFTVPTIHWRVLFVLVVLVHHRRRVLHFNVIEHPTAEWTAQQVVDAFPDDSVPSYLLRDRDQVYGHAFRQRVKGMGISEVLTAPSCPWQNPFAERLIGSIRRERPDTLRPSALPKPSRAPRRARGRTCSGAGRSRRSDCPSIRSTSSESRLSVATAATPCAWNSPMAN
jgi:hypothetical protein